MEWTITSCLSDWVSTLPDSVWSASALQSDFLWPLAADNPEKRYHFTFDLLPTFLLNKCPLKLWRCRFKTISGARTSIKISILQQSQSCTGLQHTLGYVKAEYRASTRRNHSFKVQCMLNLVAISNYLSYCWFSFTSDTNKAFFFTELPLTRNMWCFWTSL